MGVCCIYPFNFIFGSKSAPKYNYSSLSFFVPRVIPSHCVLCTSGSSMGQQAISHCQLLLSQSNSRSHVKLGSKQIRLISYLSELGS